MSSIVDAIINSDNLDLDLGVGRKDLPNKRAKERSSPRPRGPPSESNGHPSEIGGFGDDEVVGVRGTVGNRPRNPMDRAIPKVVDVLGEKVAEEFETFLDGCVLLHLYFRRCLTL